MESILRIQRDLPRVKGHSLWTVSWKSIYPLTCSTIGSSIQIHSCTYSPTHPLICESTHSNPSILCSHPPTKSSMHPFIHPFTDTFTHPFMHLHVIRPSIHQLIHPSAHSSIHRLIQTYSGIHPSTHPNLTYPSIHSWIHQSIHPSTYPCIHKSIHP